MLKRPLGILVTLFLAGIVLVACGSDDDADTTPTVPPTRNPVTATIAPGTPTAEPTVLPMVIPATPTEAVSTTSPAESTPVVAATPQTDAATAVQATPQPADSTPVPVTLSPLSGALTFEGRPQQDYVITSEGCMGLGDWRMLKAGTQVVVKDATGTVVDVGTLEAIDNGESCEWVFEIDAPDSGYFSVSIPMVTEVWFHSDDAEIQEGTIEIVVP